LCAFGGTAQYGITQVYWLTEGTRFLRAFLKSGFANSILLFWLREFVPGAFYKHCHKNLAFLPSFSPNNMPISMPAIAVTRDPNQFLSKYLI
jgi:hypothetical protein